MLLSKILSEQLHVLLENAGRDIWNNINQSGSAARQSS